MWILRELLLTVRHCSLAASFALMAFTSALPVSTATPTQQAYVKSSNTGAGDGFGVSVAASHDTIVVGAPFEASSATGINGDQNDDSAPNSGAAYVFVRKGTTWHQQAYLKASNALANQHFGGAVAISGDTIVASAVLESSNATGVDGDQNNQNASESGAAYIFVRNGTNWSQQAYLKASNTDAYDHFGGAVAISRDTVVVGADYESSNATGVNGDESNNAAGNAGAAYVFVRNGSDWSQQAYLKASNTEAHDQFGWSVSVSGDLVIVSAVGEDSNATGVNGDESDNSTPNNPTPVQATFSCGMGQPGVSKPISKLPTLRQLTCSDGESPRQVTLS